jgi:hypothetical protein
MELSANDPLSGFSWRTLHEAYKKTCKRFNPQSRALRGLSVRPSEDLVLYHFLKKQFANLRSGIADIPVETYKGMLYWKLYSMGRGIAERRCDEVDKDSGRVASSLHRCLQDLPTSIDRSAKHVPDLVRSLGKYQLPGMRSSDSWPTRTTFLHFVYPAVFPIFDSQALKSFGVSLEDSRNKDGVLAEYASRVWDLTDKHTHSQPQDCEETPLRLTEMALWICRGSS